MPEKSESSDECFEVQVHFHPPTGLLEISCGPQDFAPYLDVAKKQVGEILADEGINTQDITELNVLDYPSHLDKIHEAGKPFTFAQALLWTALTLLLGLCIVGFITAISWFV